MSSLTPEQEASAQRAFAERRFDPESYQKEIMGPELAPELQVAVAEADLAALEPALTRVERDPQDAETLAAQRQKNRELAEEFCFLDPADYADVEARTGLVMTPAELLGKLQSECGLTCWFAAASEAMIAKELNPRDVALAYRKIGENPENLHDPTRWQAAIADIRQAEAGRQAMYHYQRFGLWVARADEPVYVTWIPGCWLREYALVRFDAYGVPDWHIPGWRDVLLALIRTQFIGQEQAERVFGAATGPASKRYNMILAGLRNRPELEDSSQTVAFTTESQSPGENRKTAENQEAAATRCSECHHRFAHFPFCARYEAWYNGLTDSGNQPHPQKQKRD